MRQTPLRCFKRRITLLFLFLLSDFLVFKSFSYAEDNLNSLTQDVVYAKQKHEAISGKVETAAAFLDKDKSNFLRSEAEGLISSLDRESPVGGGPEIKSESRLPFHFKNIMVQDKPVKEIEIKVSKDMGKKAPQKKDEPYGEGKRSWLWPHFGYKEPKLTEGELLYKVAVSDNKITLKEAEEIGLANSVPIQAAQKKIEASKSKLVEAKRALFPTVQGVFERGGGKQPQPRGTAQVFRIFKNLGYKVNVSQPLFYGGELIFTVKQAEENVKSAKAEYEKAKGELVHNIRAAYYGVVKAEYNVEYQSELYGEVNAVYKKVKEAHSRKLIPEVDFLNVESQNYQVYFQAESARNDLLSADMVLHQTLNLDANKKFPVDLKLNFSKVTPNFDEILEIALANNAEVKIKAFAFESAKYGVEIYKSRRLPRFDLRGSYGRRGEMIFDDTSFTNNDPLGIGGVGPGANNQDIAFKKPAEWLLVIKGSMPLGPNSVEYEGHKNVFAPSIIAPTGGSEDWSDKYTFNLMDKFSDITDERSAQAALLQAQADYGKTKSDLTLKVRDDFYNLQKSLIQVDSSIAKVRYQDKQNSIQKYLMGLQETSAANYLEGLISQSQDKFSFIQAVTDYHLAISSLSLSVGDPDYFERES